MTVKGAAAEPDQVADATGIRVEVIGEGAVRRGAVAVAGLELGGRRARVVLAALALTDGPVPADRLATLIWPDAPPPTWPAALRGVIRSLRAALDAVQADGQRLIATTPSGYCLAPGAGVDLDLAEAAITEAAARAGQGRPEAAIAAAEPVTVLSGDQLLPGEDGSWLAPHRARADALALRALELVAESAGALGDHHRAVAAARRAVSASPLNERSHRMLFRALLGAGDRAGVVQAYEACREILAGQLGVDPALETIDAYLAAIGSAAGGASPGGTARRPAARVPQASSAFFGRRAEAAALAEALREPGLLTVAGRGGVGKTRLVTQVARAAAISAALSGGRLWVSLASVDRDELVAAEAAMALGLPIGTDDAAELIAGHLAPLGRAVLVLDGCEAVLDGTASLAVSLLAACPALTLVVTSRVPLAVEAERVIGVAPFPAAREANWRELAASDHVRLLADRARRSGGELVVDEATAPFVAELCRRCGGLPLAIELAGAQLAAMSVPDLLDHLSEPGADGADWVRAIAESSYALLDPDEATVFRRLAVLDGPVTLPFLREVVAGGAIAPVRLVRILRELTARGLLTVDRSGPHWRYHQDDDLHRMATELLAAAGEAGQAIARLADAVSAVLPAEAKAPPGPHLDAITEIIPAVRSVLGAATDGALDPRRGLDIAFRMHRYWAATNVAEGRFWLSRLLAGAPPGPGTAHATYALGYLAYWAGDTAAAAADLRSAAEQMSGQRDEYAAAGRSSTSAVSSMTWTGGRKRSATSAGRSPQPPRSERTCRSAPRSGWAACSRSGPAPKPPGSPPRRSRSAARPARPSSSPRPCRPPRWCAGKSAAWTRPAASWPRRCRCSPGHGGSPGWCCCRPPPASRWPTKTSAPSSSWAPRPTLTPATWGSTGKSRSSGASSPGRCSPRETSPERRRWRPRPSQRPDRSLSPSPRHCAWKRPRWSCCAPRWRWPAAP